MGDAAGQLTDRLHLLGLPKLHVRGVLLVQQPVLFLDKGLHHIDRNLQSGAARGRRDGFCENVGEAGEKIDVVLVVIVLLVVVDLEDAVGLVVVALDDDVDDRDDAVRGIKRRRIETCVLLQIVDDRRLTGGEGATLRRTHIGARHHMTDHAVLPAMAGDDEQVVLLGTVTAHLAEGDAETFGADPDRFVQDFIQIPLTQREAAEPGDRGLLAKQLLHLYSGICHRDARRRCRLLPRHNMGRTAGAPYAIRGHSHIAPMQS